MTRQCDIEWTNDHEGEAPNWQEKSQTAQGAAGTSTVIPKDIGPGPSGATREPCPHGGDPAQANRIRENHARQAGP